MSDEKRRVSGYLEGERLERWEEIEEEQGGQTKALRWVIDRLDRVDELEEDRDYWREVARELAEDS